MPHFVCPKELKHTLLMTNSRAASVLLPVLVFITVHCTHQHPVRGKHDYSQTLASSGMFRKHWYQTLRRYCIQPPGDGPTRHATMDCFAAGSQPLFFDQHITAVRLPTLNTVSVICLR